ncbi:hypothetical protein V7S43_012947 [Phytophthora oleae]|uniref:Uncharacterized protein n=1 Tax=Phytophthora oleae TaxID=2107226 RepID=A0ABD3F713_9STRA
MVRPQLSAISAEARSAMERLKTKLETLDLHDVRQWVLANGRDFLVEEHIPLETWNCFATRNTLPQNLKLSQLVWSAETVWLAEFTVSRRHEVAARFCDRVLVGQLGRLLALTGHMTLNTPNQSTCEADATFLPRSNVPGFKYLLASRQKTR